MGRQSYRPEVPPKDPPKGNRPAQRTEASGNTTVQRQKRNPTEHGGDFKGTGKGKGKSFAERAADQAAGRSQPTGQLFPNRQYQYEGGKLSPKCMDSNERQQYEARRQQQRLRQHRQQQEQVLLHYPNGMPTAESARLRLAADRDIDHSRRPSDTLIDNVTETVHRWKQARAEEQHIRKNEQLKSKISRPILVNGKVTASGEKRQHDREQFWNEDKRWVKMMVRAGKLKREADGSIRPPMQAPTAGKANAGKKSNVLTSERTFSFDKVAGVFRRRFGSRGEDSHGADEKRKQVKPFKDQLQVRPETAAAAAASHSFWPATDGNGFASSRAGNHQVKERTTRLGDFMVSPFKDKFKAFQGGRDRRNSDSTFFCAGLDEAGADGTTAAGLYHLVSPPPHITQVSPMYKWERHEPVKSKRRSTFSHISPIDVAKSRETALEVLTSGDLEGQFPGFEGYHYDNGDDDGHHSGNASRHYNMDDNNRGSGHKGQSGNMTVSRAYNFVSENSRGGHLANVDHEDHHYEDSDPFEYEYLSQDFVDRFLESSESERRPLPGDKVHSTPRISPVSSISPLTVEGIFAGEEQGEQVPHYQPKKPRKHRKHGKKLELALARDDSQTLPPLDEQFGQHGKYWLPAGAVAAEQDKKYRHGGDDDEEIDYEKLCAARYHPGREGEDYINSPWMVPRQRDVRVRSPRCVIEPSDRYKSWYVDLEGYR